MAFLRFTRDKRGYENFYLVEAASNRRGKVNSRVLYWFRTPPGVRVGREPFDNSVRRALEAQYPGVSFDWPSIVATPIPSADTDKWRERRRAERIARHTVASSDTEGEGSDSAAVGDAARDAGSSTDARILPSGSGVEGTSETPASPAGDDAIRKRRRRRRTGSGSFVAAGSGTSDSAAGSGTPDSAAAADPAEPSGDEERSDD